jgi:hypothetical protein
MLSESANAGRTAETARPAVAEASKERRDTAKQRTPAGYEYKTAEMANKSAITMSEVPGKGVAN